MAPEPVKVTDAPAHNAFALALADTAGAAFTVMVRCAEPEQPLAVAVKV